MQVFLSKKFDIGYFILKIQEGKNIKSIGEVHFFFTQEKLPIVKVSLEHDITLYQLNEINQYLQNYNFKESILEDFDIKQKP
jgi:hypothetical protein